jgi:hypothetical protein
MRIRASLVILAVTGLTATVALADGMPRGAKPAAPAKHTARACGCHVVHRHAARTQTHAARHVWKRMVTTGGEHMWHGERSWHDQLGWSESHEWSEGGEHFGYRYEPRPWATDAFGFLTWPGKTHFIPTRGPGDGAMPPPPPMDNSMPPPPPPGWSDDQSGGPRKGVEQDQDGYNVYRF